MISTMWLDYLILMKQEMTIIVILFLLLFLKLGKDRSNESYLKIVNLLLLLNLVAGFQALGTLMAVGLMMLPAVSARLWARSLPGQIGMAMGIAAVSAYVGLLLSYQGNLPSGPAIVLTVGAIYLLSLLAAMAFRRGLSYRS